MKKFTNLLMIAVILGATFLPPITASGATLNDWLDEGYTVIQNKILPPEKNQIGLLDGSGIYFSDLDSYKYSIKSSELNIPPGSQIEELVLLDAGKEYKKLTYNPATDSYEATIEKRGTHLFEANGTPQTLLYQWWRAGGDKTKWAFDLDGVRHWRKSSTIQDSPPQNATYFNEVTATNAFGQGTYKNNGSDSIPPSFTQTWPYANNALRYNVFWDETPGNGNVGWSYTKIPIEFDELINQNLNYQLDIDKIKNIVEMEYKYSKPTHTNSGIEVWDVSQITNQFSEEQAITQGYMNVWYRINFTDYSYEVYLPGTNGERRIFYYGEWQMTYKANVPWYTPLTLVAKYKQGTGLVDLTGGGFCLQDSTMQMTVKLNVPGLMVEDVTDKSYVTWKSSDESIATVSKGLVTAHKTGDVEITAIYAEGKAGESKISKKISIIQCSDAELTLDVELAACPIIGDTIQINATIEKRDGFVWNFLTTQPHAKLMYASSDNSVATVSNTGLITLLKDGEVVITATYTEGDGSDPIVKEIKIRVNTSLDTCIPLTPDPTDPDPNPTDPPGEHVPPPDGASSCDYIISAGGVTNVMSQSFLSGDSIIGAIESQTDEYDVVQGIPSSEYLKTYVDLPKYLYDQTYEQQSGKVIYTIKVSKSFVLEWEDEAGVPQKENATKEVEIQIERDYSYWNVGTYDVWDVHSALIKNYALPNGESLMLNTDAVTASATRDLNVENHVFPVDCPAINLETETISGGKTKPSVPDFESEAKSEAESQITPPKVKNDKAVFEGETLMTDTLTVGDGPTPSNIPSPPTIKLSAEDLLIDPGKTNYWKSDSTGDATYDSVFTLDGSTGDIILDFEVNEVTVHTPIIIYAKATDDKEHDQRVDPPKRSTPANPDTDRHAFILDRPFTVTLDTVGQHRDIPGYGVRDYSKYMKSKQVRFPFDVYSETKQSFYPANTWIEVPVNMKDATFFLPVWVPEGQYSIDYRVFAINALTTGDFGGEEPEANMTIPNPEWNVPPAGTQSAAHTAIDAIEVDVVGRLYDLHITDIEDFNWKDVFRKSDGITPSGNTYFVGLNGIDGDKRGNENPFVLPVSHASHPNGIKNLAVKTGYNFKFDMKTKGDMDSLKDAIRIKPRFYFVEKDGTNRQEVDLYYHTNDTKFIKIGSADDKTYREVVLNDPSRNVPITELANNALHYYDFADRFQLDDLKAEHTKTSFARDYTKFLSRESIQTGPYGWQILNWNLRTYRGPLATDVPANTMIPKEEALTKEQTWYGEYSIPAETYVVPKDSKINELGRVSGLNENHPIFLKDGYIIVNFDIETINEGDLENPHLSYYNSFYMSQWTDMEGFAPEFTDHYGNVFKNEEGDMIYYHGDQSALDDFQSSVTH